MRLAHTLSLMLIAAVLVTVAAMGGAMIWNLHSGFADYIQARDDERLQRFAQVVAERIAQAGSLSALASQPEPMRGLMDALAERDGVNRPPAPSLSRIPRGLPGGPPPPFGPGPRPGDDPHAAGAPGSPAAPEAARHPPPPGGGTQGDHPFGRRVVVTDPQGRQVLGLPQPADAPTRSLPVLLDGQTVATVRMVRVDDAPAGVDARFLQRQYTALAAVLLDLMLPGMDGLAICRAVRAFSDVPVLMLTARVDEVDRLLGLDTGADDYVCKPFSPREVVARVAAQVRRAQGRLRPSSAEPHWQVDDAGQRVAWRNQWLALTPQEFRLLRVLLQQPGRVFARARLLDALGTDTLDVSDRAIDSHIKNIRRKLAAADASASQCIASVYGVGYRFEV